MEMGGLILQFIRLRGISDPLFAPAWKLYEESFPKDERRTAAMQELCFSDPDYEYLAVLSRDTFCGIALLWRGPDFVYLEHLAILPELRCQKLGTQAMQQLLRENPCVVLDIEPPDTPLRMRRKAFYERQGFAVNPYPHFQPPMQKDCGRVRLLLLSRPLLDEETHERFLKFFLAKLQKYSDFRAEKAE
jgi:ribosomal protein S18 acetylase RimI-like enzyme